MSWEPPVCFSPQLKCLFLKVEKKLILCLHPLLWFMAIKACQDKQLEPNPPFHEVRLISAFEDLGFSMNSEDRLSEYLLKTTWCFTGVPSNNFNDS